MASKDTSVIPPTTDWFSPPKCTNIKTLFIWTNIFALCVLFLLSLQLFSLNTGYTISMLTFILLITQTYILYMATQMPKPVVCS